MTRFADRTVAGRRLAGALSAFADGPLVLALPRGGVPVAFEVARALDAELDVFVVRKLGVPGHEELAMGAIASGGTAVLNDAVIAELDVPRTAIDDVVLHEGRELARRERAYRGTSAPLDVRTRVVLVVDDGMATGATMRAALTALRSQAPARLIVAVPVAARETCDELAGLADEIVCPETPTPFLGVGMWYHDFTQTTDDDVRRLLASARDR